MMSKIEGVVGIEAQCGVAHQDLPKPECNGDDLDKNPQVLDVSVECGEVNGNVDLSVVDDSGRGIHVCVGDDGDGFDENQIGGTGLVAEPNDNSKSNPIVSKVVECELQQQDDGVIINSSGGVVETTAAEGEITNNSASLELDMESYPINTKEEESELQDETAKLPGGGEVPGSDSLDLDTELSPTYIKEQTDVVEVVGCELKDTNVEDGGVVEEAEHGLYLESNPTGTKEQTDDVVVEREASDVGVGAMVQDVSENRIKLSEGEVVEEETTVVEQQNEAPSLLELESKSMEEKGSMIEDVVEGEGSQEKATEVLGEVVVRNSSGGELVEETGHHEVPTPTSLSPDVAVGVVERESHGVSMKATAVKLSEGEVVEVPKEEVDVVANVVVECDPQDVSVKAEDEVVETAHLEDLNLELIPTNTKENIDVVAFVVEREMQDASVNVKAAKEVKLPDEVVENAEHVNFNLESNPVNVNEEIDVAANFVERESQGVSVKGTEDNKAKLSEGEVVDIPKKEVYVVADVVESDSLGVSLKAEDEEVETAEYEDLSLESIPTNTKENIVYVVSDVVERDSQEGSVKFTDEVKLLDEVVENAEHGNLNLESDPVNANGEIDLAADVVECESQGASVKDTEDDKVKLSDGEVVDVPKEEVDVIANVVKCDSQDASLKAEDEVVETTKYEDLNLESIPTNTKENNVDVVANVVECDSQDASVKATDEVKLSNEVVENAGHENLNMESNPVNATKDIDAAANVVECDLQDASVKAEVVETAEHEDLNLEWTPTNTRENIVGEVANVVERESQDTCVSIKSADEVKLPDEVVENAEHEILNLESDTVHVKKDIDVVSNVVECDLHDASVKAEDEVKLSGEVVQNAERDNLDLESNLVNTNEKIDVERESQDPNVKAEDNVHFFSKVVENAQHETLVSDSNLVSTNEEIDAVTDAVEHKSQDSRVKLSDAVVEIEEHEVPSSTSDVTFEPEVHIRGFSAMSSGENSSDVDKGVANNIELEIEAVEDKVVQIDDENLVLQENGNSQDNNTYVVPLRVEEASVKTKRKPFNFLVRVPRFDNESLREQIRLAKINVDEKTKLRDAIQVLIQEKRASTQIHGIDYEYAKGESRNARKLVRSKRIEIDSLQSVINKAKNALSIGDIDSQIYNMEHMIQHETLPLKEEKQLIRDIKQLKQLREKLSSNMGSKDEIKQALEQREEVEERLKILRKELDILKGKVVKAEMAAVEAEKKCDAENKRVKEIQAQFRAADDVRQAAYVHWQSLRKELSKKSEYFYKYKDDSAVASNFVFSRDTDALYNLCRNNVEKFMGLWNTNDEFRRDYVKFNTRSTIWRLGTLDGRSLGPDEVPPFLPSYIDTRVNRNVSTPSKVDLKSQFPTLESKQEKTTQSVSSDGKSTEEKSRRMVNKEPTTSVQANGSDTVSSQDIIINEVLEEPKKSKEEIEVMKKAEERERKEAEAKLKEERRLEALAKASEARERKKRQAEKLQMRAEMKTIKEAEQKEKEREKRLRKKERKKAAATDVYDTNGSEIAQNSESSAETSKDGELKDVSSVATPKKPNKHWLFGKQSKAKSTIPPPLRNRNKKKLQQWMWVGITSSIILALFWLGNMGVFSNVHFKRRNLVI